MLSQCLACLGRRSGSARDRLRAPAIAAAILVLPWCTPVSAAAPVFPNMAHSVGQYPNAVRTADLDHDGQRDLVVANRWSEDLSILRGLGGGDFAAELRLPAGGIPVALAIGDFNRDGRDDIAAALPVEDRVAIFLTQADGTPASAGLLVAGDSPGSVVAADLDHDGSLDLVAANYLDDTLSIWSGRGDGTFSPARTLAAGSRPQDIVVCLLDGNLTPDLVVGSAADEAVNVLLGDGAGGFTGPTFFSSHAPGSYGGSRTIVAADVDGDGAIDLLVNNFDNVDEFNSLVLMRGRGDGSLEAARYVGGGGDGPFTLGVGDFNRDGRPDLAYGSHHGAVCCVTRGGRIAFGRGDGTFDAASRFQSGIGPAGVAVDDFDHDGIPDIAAISDVYWSEVAIDLGNGDGTVGRMPETLDATPFSLGMATGDVDGDGRADIVSLNAWPWTLRILRGAGGGHVGLASTIPVAMGSAQVVAGDLNGDGLADLVLRDRDTGGAFYYRAIGGGAFAPPAPILAGRDVGDLTVGEVTGDGVPDLVALSRDGDGTVDVVSRPGEAAGFSVTIEVGIPNLRVVTTGDFDGDGRRDIAVAGSEAAILRNLGAAHFAAGPSIPTQAAAQAARAGDLNRDHRDDLVLAADPSQTQVLLGEPDGSLLPGTLQTHQFTPSALEIGDFDGDGVTDIVTLDDIGDDADLSIILKDASRPGFVSRRILAGAASGDFGVADLDGDGRPDLIVRGEAGLLLIRNQGPFPDRPPRALPTASTFVECTGPGGAGVTLDGRGSTDPDSTLPAIDDIATYEWFEEFDTPGQRLVATGALASVTLALGSHDLTLRVIDHAGASDVANVIVQVVDTVAPTAGVAMSPARLWPPNHQYTTVRANLSVIDACSPVSVTLVSVRSSEPDDSVGGGDGSTRNDIDGAALGTPDLEVRLRAERDGLGPGRTYTLVYRVVDGAGNATEATALVEVPINASNRGGFGGPPQGGTTGSGGTNGNGPPHGPKPRPSGRSGS